MPVDKYGNWVPLIPTGRTAPNKEQQQIQAQPIPAPMPKPKKPSLADFRKIEASGYNEPIGSPIVPQSKYEPTNPVLRKLSLTSRGIQGPAPKALDWIADALPDRVGRFLQDTTKVTPQTKTERVLSGGSELAGSFLPISGIYSGVSKIPQLARLGTYGQAAAKGAISGGIYEGGMSALEGKQLPDIAQNTAIGAVGFGAGDVALKGAGALLKGAAQANQLNRVKSLDLRNPVTAFKASTPPPRTTRSGGMVETIPARDFSYITPKPWGVLGQATTPTTQQTAERQLLDLIGNIQRPVQESMVPPLESQRQLVNYIYDGLGGEISKKEISKMGYNDLSDLGQEIAKGRKQGPLWDLAGQQAEKRGVNLDDLYRTATDPEYARMREVVGLSPTQPLNTAVANARMNERQAVRGMLDRFATPRVPNSPQLGRTSRSGFLESETIMPPRQEAAAQAVRAEVPQVQAPMKPPTIKPPDPNTPQGKLYESTGVNVKPLTGNWKDKAKFLLKRETPERNFEAVMGKDAPQMIKTFLDPVHIEEANRQRWINQQRQEIKSLGIRARSKDSKLVQQYGEGVISEDQLKQQAPKNWEKIKNTAGVMRQKYDQYLNQINTVLTRNGYDPIPARKEYFRHFQDVTSLFEQYGIPRRNIEALPTDINGITADFKPGKSFFASALRRKGNQTTFDAITGIDGYLEGASRLIFHTDNIQRLRSLEKALRSELEGTNKLSNFTAELGEYTNQLSGKKALMDRAVEDAFGRRSYAVLDWLRRRTGANMIGGNVSSALTQFIPLTQSMATTSKPAMAKALKDTIAGVVKNDGFINRSNYLTRRFGSDPLSMNLWEKGSQAASWMFRSIDRFVSELIVRGKYNEAIRKGMKPEAAMETADKWAARIMADRSLGSMPTLFNSRMLGLVTQFQLEVNNQISFLLKDIPASSKSKMAMASAMGQLFLYGYLYNNLFEKMAGYRPALDPIGVAKKALEDYGNPSVRKQKATSNLIYNTANQLPFASTFTGGRIPIGAGIPNPISVATGKSDITSELAKPATYLIPPFGGGQAKKTITGMFAADKGGVYQNGNLKFPVENNPSLYIFGPNNSPNAREYYRNDRRPLSEQQTQLYQRKVAAGQDKQQVYDKMMVERQLRGIQAKIADIREDKKLTPQEKRKQISVLIQQQRELRKGSK